MKHGIDISKWQGRPDWDKLAAQHKAGRLDFVILRAGLGGGTVDPRFEENYAAARARGIPVGAYWYAYWGRYTPAQEAASFLRTVEGKLLEYGLWYDVEYEPDILALSKAERTTWTLEGLDRLAASGRYVGLYASTDMVNNRMEYDRLRPYDIWVAQYNTVNTCKLPYGIWQYTSGGSVEGVSGRVDRDRAYKDYPAFVVGKLAGATDSGGESTGSAGGTDRGNAQGTADGTGEGSDVTDAADKPQASTAGADSDAAGGMAGSAAGDAAPDQESRLPRETVTRRYGPMTRGDLLRLFETADGLGLYILGELTVGPASSGDDKVLRALAAELKIGCTEVA